MHELFECLFHCFALSVNKVVHVHLVFDMRKKVNLKTFQSCMCPQCLCVLTDILFSSLQSDKEGNNISPRCKLNHNYLCTFVMTPFSSFWRILSYLHCSIIGLEHVMPQFSSTVLSRGILTPLLRFTTDSEFMKISDFKTVTQFHRDALCVLNGL